MNKNDLLVFKDNIIRVLEIKENKLLVINCTSKSVPAWINTDLLSDYTINNKALQPLPDITTLDTQKRKVTYERFTMISRVLPFIKNKSERCHTVAIVADEYNISRQTVNYYLWLFLAYQNISALAPNDTKHKREITDDEKNMRWAIHKFFYTRYKQTLTTTYTLMLKEKYCDNTGALLPHYPSFNQFRYYYRKHKNLRKFYISRNGIKHYQKNNRPLLGDGVQDFAPTIGHGMLDATVCDIYLINDYGGIIGRPILTACVDAYSGLCCGYSLSWEGGVYSLRGLLLNVIADKKKLCKPFGIDINNTDWPCNKLPAVFVTDKGKEYVSDTFEQIVDLGVKIINLPPYRPELKGIVEKFFDIIQNLYKPYLHGKGIIEPDFQERGARDYRKDACLTMFDFEKILLHCIVYYNSKRPIDNFPLTEEMLSDGLKPYPNEAWNYQCKRVSNLISVDKNTLILTLLPRTKGKFSRKGLMVNKLRYKNENYTEQYLSGGECVVAYNPDNVSSVWLIENGKYIEFELIEARFSDKNSEYVAQLLNVQKSLISDEKASVLQAKIDLSNSITAVINSAIKPCCADIKGIRGNRKQAEIEAHKDYIEEADK